LPKSPKKIWYFIHTKILFNIDYIIKIIKKDIE
jgi:hypothetical protein